jgi:very-short-patch-repair endonuclease
MRLDSELARLAERQNANLTSEQLEAGGLSAAQIATRVRRGDLYRMFFRVYAVADPDLVPLCRETAAVLSLGDRAALGGLSATALWGLTPPPPQIHVVVAGAPRARPGVRIRQVTRLNRADIRTARNVRVLSPARAIIDSAGAIDVGRAIAEAMAKRILTPEELRAALGRAPANHPGAAVLRRYLRQDRPVLTRSGKERKLRRLLQQARLPMPQSCAQLLGFEVDFYWPAHRLVVEVDTFGTHGSRRSFESDRKRDQLLAAKASITVLRLTDDQLDHEPMRVIATIAQAMVASGTTAA